MRHKTTLLALYGMLACSCAGNMDLNPPAGQGLAQAGRVGLHRLNRTEYNNSVRDLLGTQQQPANAFTADPTANGFDNNAAALTLSGTALALYETAAEALASEAVTNNPNFNKLVPCAAADTSTTCVGTFVQVFGRRAWRRPLSQDETAQVVTAATASAVASNFSQQIETAIHLLLMSPNFLFRVELDPNPASATPHFLAPYELATRLSYLVWSSGPDDVLLQAAADNSILQESVLLAQLQRMLKDPRASAFTDNFAGQWLELRNTATYQPDAKTFPTFDEPLRTAMLQESSMVFADVLHGTLPINQLLTANYTYVNDRLATHYGLPKVNSDQLQRISTDKTPRQGLLGQAAVLTATSFPTRTSLVHRGQYVLAQLLCSPPPPAPPNVPALDMGAVTPTGTQRQRLEAHAKDGACAACHNAMDPYGIVLETFDGIGAARTQDNGLPVDPNVVLPDGASVGDLGSLSKNLAADPRFNKCVVQQLFAYGLGRGITDGDSKTVTSLEDALAGNNFHFDALLEQLVLSSAFRAREGEPSSP